eukprot:g43696.t1
MAWVFLLAPWLLSNLLVFFSPSLQSFLQRRNLKLSLLSLSGHSTKVCGPVWRLGNGRWKHCLALWFSPGPYMAGLGALCSLCFLAYNFLQVVLASGLVQILLGNAEEAGKVRDIQNNDLLTVVVPGITFPWEQLGYFWLSILIAVTFHEVGHALAAAVHGVRTLSIGFSWWVFVPIAWVQLDTASRNFLHLPAKHKLCISAAGVWHNLALSALCLAVTRALPFLLSGVYAHAEGLRIAHVDAQQSPALAVAFPVGTIITHVDNLAILHSKQWQEALLSAGLLRVDKFADTSGGYVGKFADKSAEISGRNVGKSADAGGQPPVDELAVVSDTGWDGPVVGRCVLTSSLHTLLQQPAAATCCERQTETSSSSGLRGTDSAADSTGTNAAASSGPQPSCWNASSVSASSSSFSSASPTVRQICARARDLLTRAAQPCRYAQHCRPDHSCLSPALPDLLPTDRLVLLSFLTPQAMRASPSSKQAMAPGVPTSHGQVEPELSCFLGHPAQLLADVTVTDFAARPVRPGSIAILTRAAHWLEQHGLQIPEMLLRFLAYLTAVSASLGLLNAAPIYYADGAISIGLLLEHCGRADVGKGHDHPPQARPWLLCGTGLLFLVLLTSFAQMASSAWQTT